MKRLLIFLCLSVPAFGQYTEPVSVQAVPPSAGCGMAPLIKVTNIGLWECINYQWQQIAPVSGGGATFPATPGLVYNNDTLTSRNATASDITTLLGHIPLYSDNNLSDLVNVATARVNLGLGTAATASLGTSGSTVPLLSSNNTWNGTQSFNDISFGGSQTFTGVQGTTGAKLAAATGVFVTGNVRITDANGNEVDGGVPGGVTPYPPAGIPVSNGVAWGPSYGTTGSGSTLVVSNGSTLTGNTNFDGLYGNTLALAYTGTKPAAWPFTVGPNGETHCDNAGNCRAGSFNGVGITTSGPGTNVLFDDGTYKPIPTALAEGHLHLTNQTGGFSSILCGGVLPSCTAAGQYVVEYAFTQEGTPCTDPGTGGWVALYLQWEDSNGVVHAGVPVPVEGPGRTGSGVVGFDSRFYFQTTHAAAYGSGSFNISIDGGGSVGVSTNVNACATGTGTYQLDITIHQVQ